VSSVSPKNILVRKLCYSGAAVFSIAVFSVFLPQEWFSLLNIYVINAIILFLFISNIILNQIILNKLISIDYSFYHEYTMMGRINDEIEKTNKNKWSVWVGRLVNLFLIPFIISASNELFVIIIVLAAIVVIYPLRKLVLAYMETEFISIKPVWIYLNFFISIGISIPLYIYSSSKFLSFICLLSSVFSKYIVDGKYSSYFYMKIDEAN